MTTDPYTQINALASETHGGRPLIVSTFSGYGGLDLGVQAATGGRVVAHVEWEVAPSRILAHHWPDVPNLGDVTTVEWARMPHGNRVILTTGFPCQDVSLAGLRRGLKSGTRSGLWSEVALAIDEIRPGLVVIENVRGLLSAEATSPVEQDAWDLGDRRGGPTLRALGAVLGDLADLGYDARWCGLRAADAGAPHGRFRVFVIAYPAGQPWRPYAPDTHGAGLGVLGRLSAVGGDADRRGGADADGDAAEPTARLLPTPLTSNRKGAGPHGEGSPNLQTEVLDLLPTPRASRGASNIAEPTVAVSSPWGPYAAAIDQWERVTRRLAPSPTNPDGKGGAHRLAPEFSEWMMGLNAGHVTDPGIWAGMKPGTARAAQLKAIGNGVVPQHAELATRSLIAAEWAEVGS